VSAPFLDALKVVALADPAIKAAAAAVDTAAHDAPSGVLTWPEIEWALSHLQEIDVNPQDFERLTQLFMNGKGLIELVGRPALRVSGRTLPVVFELPEDVTMEGLLAVSEPTGLDLIVVKDSDGRRFVAVNARGRLHRVVKGVRGVLATEKFREVQVVHVTDVNNGFFEGASMIPRRVWKLVGDTFGNALDAQLEATVADNVGQIAGQPPAKEKQVNVGLVTAALMGLGTIGLGAALATAPTAAYILLGLMTAGSLYNGLRGWMRRPDLFFVLNMAGVQVARSHRLGLEFLDGDKS